MSYGQENARRALNGPGLYGQIGGLVGASERVPTDLEIAERAAQQRKYMIDHNRRQCLEIALGLGRFDDIAHAIRGAKEIAAFLNLEIE